MIIKNKPGMSGCDTMRFPAVQTPMGYLHVRISYPGINVLSPGTFQITKSVRYSVIKGI